MLYIVISAYRDITACIVISYFVSRPYSANIRRLRDCMSNFNAESLNQSVEIRTNTELDQMAEAYNHTNVVWRQYGESQ